MDGAVFYDMVQHLIVSALISWFSYSFPILIYANSSDRKISRTKANAIAIIYTICVYIVLLLVSFATLKIDVPSWLMAIIWGFINRWILRHRIESEPEPEEEPVRQAPIVPAKQMTAKEAFPIDSQPAKEDPQRNDPVMHYGINNKTYLESAFSMYMSGRFSADAFRKICDQSDNGVYYDLDKLADRLNKKKGGE